LLASFLSPSDGEAVTEEAQVRPKREMDMKTLMMSLIVSQFKSFEPSTTPFDREAAKIHLEADPKHQVAIFNSDMEGLVPCVRRVVMDDGRVTQDYEVAVYAEDLGPEKPDWVDGLDDKYGEWSAYQALSVAINDDGFYATCDRDGNPDGRHAPGGATID
jgi:hypothetical protein